MPLSERIRGRGSLIAAACLSVLLSALGFGSWGLLSDPRSSEPILGMFWLPALMALPFSLIVLASRKWLRPILWILALANWGGEFQIIQDSSRRGTSVLSHLSGFARVPLTGLFALLGPQVILAILIAILVEYSYYLDRRPPRVTGGLCGQ